MKKYQIKTLGLIFNPSVLIIYNILIYNGGEWLKYTLIPSNFAIFKNSNGIKIYILSTGWENKSYGNLLSGCYNK